jgi:triosephosphate isomerase
MRQIIIGNWKMNGSAMLVEDIARAVRAEAASLPRDLVLCPPATLIAPLAAALAGTSVAVGGQDCHARRAGAHTGDIAAAMLREAGASHVILGHSERRADHGESDVDVCAKTEAARAAGLTPIVCVGEAEAARQAGRAEAVVMAQLAASLPEDFTAGGAGLVAYEPIWAIGSGRTPTADDITAMHDAIRAALRARFGAAGARIPLLYGGSVKPVNAAAVLALPEVGGALVGGASLVAGDFLAIAAAAMAPALGRAPHAG